MLAAAVCLLPVAAVAADPPAPAQPGVMQRHFPTYDAPAEVGFVAAEPGVLTVMVVNGRGEDMVAVVVDDNRQDLPDGWIDNDPALLNGGEIGVVALPAAGSYSVLVYPWDEAAGPTVAEVTLGFQPLAALESPADPQGKPLAAAVLEPGVEVGGALGLIPGDRRDWYTLKVERDGPVQLTLRVPAVADADLLLQVFEPGVYWRSIFYADGTDEQIMGNETMTIDGRAGETLYVRVGAWEASAQTVYLLKAEPVAGGQP